MMEEYYRRLRAIKHFKVQHIYCDPKAKVTVVIFEDNSKEICRCAKGDVYNEYAGICICLAKYCYSKNYIEKIVNDKKSVYNKPTKQKEEKK